jgi:hypothetical protein
MTPQLVHARKLGINQRPKWRIAEPYLVRVRFERSRGMAHEAFRSNERPATNAASY